MGKKLAYERYHWFYGQIKARRYPNARKLSQGFEFSENQVQSDIDLIQNRSDVPILEELG